jgi:hemerythrin superfamily protein
MSQHPQQEIHMPTNSDALDLLKMQHDEVEDLFDMIESSTSDDAKAQLFAELADKLAAHAKIEETIFYPAVMAKQTEEILLESVEEHLAIKRVLADLLELEISDPQFDAKLKVMKEQVGHHAREEEEAELFPKVRKLLAAEDLAALGGEMLSSFEELLRSDPRMQVPSETAVAATLD